MTEQLVGVDLRQGEYFVLVYSKTTKGTWVLDGTPVRLDETATADQLGMAIRAALDRSRVGADELTRDAEPARPLLDLLKLPDFATYTKGTRSVEVYRDGDVIEITPLRNEGGRRGFTPIEGESRTIDNASPGGVGTMVIAALGKIPR